MERINSSRTVRSGHANLRIGQFCVGNRRAVGGARRRRTRRRRRGRAVGRDGSLRRCEGRAAYRRLQPISRRLRLQRLQPVDRSGGDRRASRRCARRGQATSLQQRLLRSCGSTAVYRCGGRQGIVDVPHYDRIVTADLQTRRQRSYSLASKITRVHNTHARTHTYACTRPKHRTTKHSIYGNKSASFFCSGPPPPPPPPPRRPKSFEVVNSAYAQVFDKFSQEKGGAEEWQRQENAKPCQIRQQFDSCTAHRGR